MLYEKPLPISDQIDILRAHWPSLNPDKIAAPGLESATEIPLEFPAWIDGVFALPHPKFFGKTYREQVAEALKALEVSRGGNLAVAKETLMLESAESESVSTALGSLGEGEPDLGDSDIVVMAAYLGVDKNPREKFQREEFPGAYGLGIYAATVMLITHPGRLCVQGDPEFCSTGDYCYVDDEVALHHALRCILRRTGRLIVKPWDLVSMHPMHNGHPYFLVRDGTLHLDVECYWSDRWWNKLSGPAAGWRTNPAPSAN